MKDARGDRATRSLVGVGFRTVGTRCGDTERAGVCAPRAKPRGDLGKIGWKASQISRFPYWGPTGDRRGGARGAATSKFFQLELYTSNALCVIRAIHLDSSLGFFRLITVPSSSISLKTRSFAAEPEAGGFAASLGVEDETPPTPPLPTSLDAASSAC